MTNAKPRVGLHIVELNLPAVDGSRSIAIGAPKDRWTMLFVYRGGHCPRCKRFLNKLNEGLPAWVEVMDVVVSNGPAARPDLEELLDGMTFNIKNDRPVRGTA